ncbi:MAG: aminopeptidase P family protein [Candidatus Levybacteria bacterium]|nr:aminopeptidase P family protein [Candidatus Levybacteria bacterium]
MNTRLLKLKNDLKKKNIDAILVSSVPNITYLTGYSGFSKEEREALLLITANKQYILTDKRYVEELRHVILATQSEAWRRPESSPQKDSGVLPWPSQGSPQNDGITFELVEVSSSIPFRIALEKLIKKHKIKKLGIEEDNLTIVEYKSLKRCSIDLNHWSMASLRAVKENDEIKVIEKACEMTDKTFEYILTKIKPGITERELAFEIEFFIKKNGGNLAFPSIVAFGKNSAVPHHKTSNYKSLTKNRHAEFISASPKILNQVQNNKNGNIVLLDFGAKVNDYCSDMTRVVFLGKATDEQKMVYKTVLEAQKRALDFLNRDHPYQARIGMIPAKNADKAAHDYIRSKGFGKNIFHSLGHGVGLEIHEAPRLSAKSKEILKPGMVFTIEPGVYLPDKFGVRIEDTVVLEKSGLRLLTRSPKTLIEL